MFERLPLSPDVDLSAGVGGVDVKVLGRGKLCYENVQQSYFFQHCSECLFTLRDLELLLQVFVQVGEGDALELGVGEGPLGLADGLVY